MKLEKPINESREQKKCCLTINSSVCWHKFVFSVFRCCSFYVCILVAASWASSTVCAWIPFGLLWSVSSSSSRVFAFKRIKIYLCRELAKRNIHMEIQQRKRASERGGGVERIEREERVKRKEMYRLYDVRVWFPHASKELIVLFHRRPSTFQRNGFISLFTLKANHLLWFKWDETAIFFW